jgi:fatty-acyl-CoA synthase
MSHVNTTSDPRIPAADRCVVRYLLDRLAAERGDDAYAVFENGESWSFSETRERVIAVAAGLARLGVQQGEHVAVWLSNGREGLLTFLAINYLGAVFVPFNTAYKGRILEHVIDNSDARVIVAHAQLAPLLDEVAPAQLRTVVLVGEGAAPSTLGSVAFSSLSEGDSTLPELKRPIQPWDTQSIIYTSGTTGPSKGVLSSYLHIFTNAGPETWHFVTGEDRFLVNMPLFHIGGLNVTTMVTFQTGGHVVLLRNFDPGLVLEAIARYRVQTMFGAPAMFLFMAQHPDFAGTDLSSVEILVGGGAPVPELLVRIYKARGVKLCQGYGLTETAPFATFLGSRWIESKPGSAGLPPLYGEVRVVDAANQALPHGEKGEVCVRAPNVMRGYCNRPEATREAIDPEGWFHTGDIGYFDHEGFLFLCDRVKDMVITGGENVYPAEVEGVLCEHPAIAEVAVIGLPDTKWGEAVTAVARLKEGATLTLEELRDFAGERLARYKLPLRLHLLPELPRNPAGKVLKYQLRERFAGA